MSYQLICPIRYIIILYILFHFALDLMSIMLIPL